MLEVDVVRTAKACVRMAREALGERFKPRRLCLPGGRVADVNVPLSRDSPLRALELASGLGQPRMVRRLLAAGAVPDAKGENTALVAAAEIQDAEVVRILLAAGASPLVAGHYDRLPLVWPPPFRSCRACSSALRSLRGSVLQPTGAVGIAAGR